jgi:hypothetical protein
MIVDRPCNRAGDGLVVVVDCAPFCAPPASKSVALGSNGKGKQIIRSSTENQHHSKLSHSVGKMYAATVNRRVASSGLCLSAARFEKLVNAEQELIIMLVP